ncbi:sodium:proton antiporter [Clostridium botulinum A2 117]|uniref:cation:proton antiporter n=1 Tax=Clostridium botulinum TaxID=1491 RepID=UPI0007E02262|nr:cation:proton antiporter [Clostridium botulinum]KEI79593.1 sodium:proton antiporter [Clostridium botulinum A2 117]MBN3416669.1 cation:proton antiporter [Clostridium botulinum]MBN3443160.1 cation:proton antiporter [Clostridium botulinum]MBY6807110.1 cation:proton antiporter [Clostridium botulinum]
MLSYEFLLDLAIILLSTKVLGMVTKKLHMPRVVGALLAGLILGPCVLNIVHETDFLAKMAQLGVIILMFSAGLQTDLKELKKCGRASLIIAILGTVVPLLGGYFVSALFFDSNGIFDITSKVFIKNFFIGVILTATSVSITVETLQELGRLKTRSGTAILGAAIIDDILGIIILTMVTSSTNNSTSINLVLLKIVAFFILSAICGIVLHHIFNKIYKRYGNISGISVITLSFCLIMAFIAEHFFGVADITGAFIAGVIISNTSFREHVEKNFEVISYMLLSPVFFASIGLNTTMKHMNNKMRLFTIALLLMAILAKVIGCFIGGRICKYTYAESLRIGIGMISRGEVALIIAKKGAALGLIEAQFFGSIVFVVIATTLITPILLKMVYSTKFNDIKAYDSLHSAA